MSLSRRAEKFPPGSRLSSPQPAYLCLSYTCHLSGNLWEKSVWSLWKESKEKQIFLCLSPLPPAPSSGRMLCRDVNMAGRAQEGAGRWEVALICKIHGVFILGMAVMGWGRERGSDMSLHFITAWALALSFRTCHESKKSLALITSHKYCIASDFRDGWQQAGNYNELLQMPSSHKLQLFSFESACLPTSGFWFPRQGWVFMCLGRGLHFIIMFGPLHPILSPLCLPCIFFF